MNFGCTATAASERAGACDPASAAAGIERKETIAMSALVYTMSDAYVARYVVEAASIVSFVSSGPTMPPRRPPAITREIALALKSGAAASAAAKRKYWPKPL